LLPALPPFACTSPRGTTSEPHRIRSFTGPVGEGFLHGLKLVAVAVVAQAIWAMTRALAPDRASDGIALAGSCRGEGATGSGNLGGVWPVRLLTLYAALDLSNEWDAHALRPRPISTDSAAAVCAARRRSRPSADPRADPSAALRVHAARSELRNGLLFALRLSYRQLHHHSHRNSRPGTPW
jgi:hypothetical protein